MPGAAKLKTALRQRGIPFNNATVDAMVKKSEARQLQERPKFKYDGKIVSTDKDARWAADCINYTAQPSGNMFKHILVCRTFSPSSFMLNPHSALTQKP